MARIFMADHLTPNNGDAGQDVSQAGPFVTISRQFGCHGFSLGLLLMEILNDTADPDNTWRIYHREILERLAVETNIAADLLEHHSQSKTRLLVEFSRSLQPGKTASAFEIRKRIATMVRGLAMQGHAIIIGQGGESVAHDLPNGLSVRLEAPEEWRIRQVAMREGLAAIQARRRVTEMERQREATRRRYEKHRRRTPAFHLVYDASMFTLTQIAQSIAQAMKFRGLTNPAS